MTDYADLIGRLEAGSGEDGILDMDIEWAVSEWVNKGGGYRQHKTTGVLKRFDYTRPSAHYTGPLDAALTFADAVLPGYGVTLAINTDGSSATSAHVLPSGPDSCGVSDPRAGFSRCHDPARALCAATLRALATKDADHD